MLIDLHCHSKYSSGCQLEPQEVVRAAAQSGLDGVCFTDLNTLDAAADLPELRRGAKVAVFVGAEISTDHGHYLCFFPDPARVPAPAQIWGAPSGGKPWSTAEVIAKVRSMGGVAVAAHPYDRGLEHPAGDFLFKLVGLSAIESYCSAQSAASNRLAAEAAEHLGVPCVAGSGARESAGEIGRAATLFKRGIGSEAELVAAIQAGEVWPVAIGEPPSKGGGFAPRGPARRGA